MAVINQYTDTNIVNNIPAPAYKTPGQLMFALYETFTIAASDSNGSVYRCFKALPPNAILQKIDVACDAITGSTSADLGLYDTELGAVISGKQNVFMSAQTLASASAFGINGMANVNHSNFNKKLYEHAGHTEVTKRGAGYDLALTLNTAGGTQGNVSVRIYYLQG